ncbi:hypothetical protein Cgig2_022701 [Carnegiea gigantea]|uniref:Uncharacterized protein n=1 Tax=Carnegiea gigantea TaxID=171969 RepID=A0A9Q1JSA1_9CARY|nr:hypothetical protein Cgig2_022701 [Carnegiea gigantea]
MKGSSAPMEMVKAARMQDDNKQSFRTNLHTADVVSANDAQEREPFGEAMEPLGEKEMVASPNATEEDVVPRLKCNTEQPYADDVGEARDVHIISEGSNSSIPSAKQISPYINLVVAPCTGKRRIRNVYTSRKRSRKATTNTSKEKEVEEKKNTGTELNIAADSSGTVTAGDAPIPQLSSRCGSHHVLATGRIEHVCVAGTVDSGEELITVGDSKTIATVDGTGPSLVSFGGLPGYVVLSTVVYQLLLMVANPHM